VVQSTLKGEEPLEDLNDLGGSTREEERSERDGEYREDEESQFYESLGLESCNQWRQLSLVGSNEVRTMLGREAMLAEEEDEEGRGEINKDVFKVEQGGEESSTEVQIALQCHVNPNVLNSNKRTYISCCDQTP
jgi:hypothetical protein